MPRYRYRLRTLLIFLALGPPLLAGAWWWATSNHSVEIVRYHAGGEDRRAALEGLRKVIRAAGRFGVSPLDIGPETKINPSLLSDE